VNHRPRPKFFFNVSLPNEVETEQVKEEPMNNRRPREQNQREIDKLYVWEVNVNR